MTSQITTRDPVVAGLLSATCSCCDEPQGLMGHPSLDPSRLMCANTRRIHLDRGDGVFELEAGAAPAGDGEVEVLSDRPVKTGPKTRIQLERATFA